MVVLQFSICFCTSASFFISADIVKEQPDSFVFLSFIKFLFGITNKEEQPLKLLELCSTACSKVMKNTVSPFLFLEEPCMQNN